MAKLKYSVYSLLLALGIGALLMLIMGIDPLSTYWAILQGSFKSVSKVMDVLAFTTPLILTGLGATIAFRGGVFNIGGEGQLCVGGLAAVLAGLYVDLPWPWPLLVALLAGFIAGAIWALIPTSMVGTNVVTLVVGTTMMNSIATMFTEYLVRYHFLRPLASTNETENVGPGAVLPRFSPNSQLNYGIFIAIGCVLIAGWLLFKTPTGFSIRMVGMNPRAANLAGVNVYGRTLLAMAISGGLCGLAGAVQCLGVYNRFMVGFSPGYGFDGITIASLAGRNPYTVPLAAFFFGMLRSASISMNLKGNVPVDFILVLQGIIIVLVATPNIWTTFSNLFYKLRRRLAAVLRKPGVVSGEGLGGDS